MSDDYPLEFEHETFGKFTYDDGTRWFEGQMNFLSQQVKLWIYWIEADKPRTTSPKLILCEACIFLHWR